MNLEAWENKIKLALEMRDIAFIRGEVKRLKTNIEKHEKIVRENSDKAGISTEKYLNLAIKEKKFKFNKRRKF